MNKRFDSAVSSTLANSTDNGEIAAGIGDFSNYKKAASKRPVSGAWGSGVTSQRITQIVVSVGAVLVALTHLIWPQLSIDGITMVLLLIAICPWLLPLFKSVELPGGVKLEFQELQATEQRAQAAGLLDEPPLPQPGHEYSFQIVADEDANLALAGLRIEIERRLGKLAEGANLGSSKLSIGRLLRLLGERGILTREQQSVLADMVGLLNSAAHGAVADQQSAHWALSVGPRLLATLDKRIQLQL